MSPSDPWTATRAERLDRRPLTAAHGRLVGGACVGWALDAMDVGLISFVMAALGGGMAGIGHHAVWIASIGFMDSIGFRGMALGVRAGAAAAEAEAAVRRFESSAGVPAPPGGRQPLRRPARTGRGRCGGAVATGTAAADRCAVDHHFRRVQRSVTGSRFHRGGRRGLMSAWVR